MSIKSGIVRRTRIGGRGRSRRKNAPTAARRSMKNPIRGIDVLTPGSREHEFKTGQNDQVLHAAGPLKICQEALCWESGCTKEAAVLCARIRAVCPCRYACVRNAF